MDGLKYTVIKNDKQYFEYCDELERLLENYPESKVREEVDLLQLLIDTYDEEFDTLGESDPVELLTYLMTEHKMKARDLAEMLNVSKGLVSDILNYKKGMSKEIIRKLAKHFKMRQEAFNRPYLLATATIAKRKVPVSRVAQKPRRVAKGKRKYHET